MGPGFAQMFAGNVSSQLLSGTFMTLHVLGLDLLVLFFFLLAEGEGFKNMLNYHGWEEKMRIGITHPSKVLTHVSDRV